MITLRFDGLYRSLCPNNNPQEKTGLMCYGWVIFRDGRSVAHGHGAYARPEDASSNSAEYLALIEGLQALRVMGMEREPIEVIGDARSVIDQMLGWPGSARRSRARFITAPGASRAIFIISDWLWQPRRDNTRGRRAYPPRAAPGAQRPDKHPPGAARFPCCRARGLTALLDLCVFSGI